ncbi:MAG: hypothetical protein HOP96_10450 [Sphingomonas sp.]|nr:hypothetical protein [Sphingomonas sp.]
MIFSLPPPDPALEISIASRGYSKGVAQSDGMQVVIRSEVGFGAFKLGAYGKNVTSPQYDGEAGVSIGYKKTFGKAELNATATVKHLYGAGPGVDDVALELNFAATRSWGAFKPRVGLTYSPDELAGTGRSAYWEAGSSYQIDKKTSASAGIGVRRRTGGPDYTSFNAGLSRTLGGPFTADVRLYDTDRNSLGENFHRRVVVSLRTRI